MNENMKMSVHDKAVRLVEGGIVEVDGLCVRLNRDALSFLPCDFCEMDSICYEGTEMWSVCVECDNITNEGCFLMLVKPQDKGLC